MMLFRGVMMFHQLLILNNHSFRPGLLWFPTFTLGKQIPLKNVDGRKDRKQTNHAK